MYSTQNLSFSTPFFHLWFHIWRNTFWIFFAPFFLLRVFSPFFQKNVAQSHGNKNNNSNEEIESGGGRDSPQKRESDNPMERCLWIYTRSDIELRGFERGFGWHVFLWRPKPSSSVSPFVWLDCWWCKLECWISNDTVFFFFFFCPLGHFVAIRHWPTKCFYRKKVLFFSQNVMFSIFLKILSGIFFFLTFDFVL